MGFALFLAGFFCSFVAAIFASVYIPRKSGAPFFPTPSSAIRDALREVNLQPGAIFYDLGAGTGKALAIAEKEFGAKATGFEISILVLLLAKLNLLIRGYRSKVKFKNLFKMDLRSADVVFCFLTEKTLKKVEAKLIAEMRPGTWVVCYTFPLPTKKPAKILPVKDNWKMLLYQF